ncbi:hypothetical protein ACQP3C_26885, partial [Escherichia coli]
FANHQPYRPYVVGFPAQHFINLKYIKTKRETADVKKPTGEVGFFTVPLQSGWLWSEKNCL